MSEVKNTTAVDAVPPPAYSNDTHASTGAGQTINTASTPAQHGISAQPYESYAPPTKPDEARMQYERPNEARPAVKETTQTMVTPLFRLGEAPAAVDCPYCRQTTQTRVETHSSSMTIVAGVVIGLFCICLACVPCCMGACADVDHYCARCGKQLTHRPHDGQVNVLDAQAAGPQSGNVPSQYSKPAHAQTVNATPAAANTTA